MSRYKLQFSLRTLLTAITVVAVTIAFVTHHYQFVVAIVAILFWVGDVVVRSGFIEAWPDLQGPRITERHMPGDDSESNANDKTLVN
jgi:hypothetical protein